MRFVCVCGCLDVSADRLITCVKNVCVMPSANPDLDSSVGESLPLLEQHARLQERELALDLVGHCCVLLGALGRGGEESGAAGGSDALQVGLRLSLLSVPV